mmetsp:Transcript_34782/g.80398  ORF Transcript_34782/g.80398 Transcript_34782/m.80398 type:complete len:240 (-) Transcript_34782:400-1119(-)
MPHARIILIFCFKAGFLFAMTPPENTKILTRWWQSTEHEGEGSFFRDRTSRNNRFFARQKSAELDISERYVGDSGTRNIGGTQFLKHTYVMSRFHPDLLPSSLPSTEVTEATRFPTILPAIPLAIPPAARPRNFTSVPTFPPTFSPSLSPTVHMLSEMLRGELKQTITHTSHTIRSTPHSREAPNKTKPYFAINGFDVDLTVILTTLGSLAGLIIVIVVSVMIVRRRRRRYHDDNLVML